MCILCYVAVLFFFSFPRLQLSSFHMHLTGWNKAPETLLIFQCISIKHVPYQFTMQRVGSIVFQGQWRAPVRQTQFMDKSTLVGPHHCAKNTCFFFLINAGLHSSNIYSVPACLYARVNHHPLNLYGAPTLWTAAPRKLPGATSKCLRHSLTTRKLETLRRDKLNTGVVKLWAVQIIIVCQRRNPF